MPIGKFFLVITLLISSCKPGFIPIANPRMLENYFSIIEESSRRITQIRGVVDIRGTGLLGQFFHERADIIVTSPHYLLWSLRSFFQAPLYMMAVNGRYVTIRDFNNSFIPYEQIQITKDTVVDIFDIPFHPQSLINMLLNRLELSGATNFNISVRGNLWRIEADQEDGWHVVAFFNEETRVLNEISLEDTKRTLVYQVKYSEMSRVGETIVPKLLTVSVIINKKSIKFAIHFDQIEVNATTIPPDNFFLSPTNN